MTSSVQEPAKMAPATHMALQRRVLAAVGVQNVSLLLALVVLVAFIGAQNSNFFYASNIATIGTTIAIVGVLAVVQTVVMLLGGLDISVGSQAGLTSVVSAMVFMATGSALAGIAAALALGLCLGLLNGVVIIYGRVNAVIATLATFAAFRGLANLVSDGRAQGYTGVNHLFVFLARGDLLGIPVLIWILLLIAALVQVMLHYTDIGRNIYAVGGNATAARLAGIPLNRYIIGCYMLVGFVAALAGILLTARTGSGQPTSGSQGLELQSITAAALGGVALQGGRGTIVGTILAVILLGVLENGLIILNVNSFWQDIAQGALLVIAVVIQQRRAGGNGVGLP
ncbi:ABC transporter permease [Acidisoma cellulosilytica]|uniref:ABC transporter permease n=1 Tax=Acidisoma cellulosilyticum TaxID=2802395 RepID=A0A963Z718_9PROT|nr:ABC transporter permease [Acidisoma cellulosilyticum]MCB8883761.1 ABC transporter permease [Acidisoma cellulosilyticum]